MTYTCDACGTSVDHSASSGHIPLGWRFQRIVPRVVTLCDSCSFLCPHDDTSPVLLDLLRARDIAVSKPERAPQPDKKPSVVKRALRRLGR